VWHFTFFFVKVHVSTIIPIAWQCSPIVIAKYGGGECAYIQSGLIKKYQIDKLGSYFAFCILWMLIVWNLCIVT